ncbi:MAG TPA: glucuronate isomerase [Chitinophagaceae bacterium]|nr:glucuronate isomerase [Chitinophagaceae bacterium]
MTAAKKFLDSNFLLQTKTAELLYHVYAEPLPLVDFHCHLPVERIASNQPFENITELWLTGDHYKWRAMRANGTPEKYISGDASAEEKFFHWACAVPYTLRNPLFHWAHLELSRVFGIEKLLNEASAREIYRQCNEKLRQPGFSPRGILLHMNVETVCTTDDPTDDLEFHQKIRKSHFTVRILPGFRPDRVLETEHPGQFNAYLDKLSAAAGTEIRTYEELLETLRNRIDYFHQQGCRLSDHGLEHLFNGGYTEKQLKAAFKQIREKKTLDQQGALELKAAILRELCKMYHLKGWVQQFHLGAIRNNNTRIRRLIGQDAGTDSIGDFPQSRELSRFLDGLDLEDRLARTILYNVNPADNEVFATMAANFNDGSTLGKVQWGPAWWFMDQKEGMERQLNTLSAMNLLSRFVGMVTDSRSFLSYPRHEYFRRILCNLLGRDAENGELPDDIPLLGKMCVNICYQNAKDYFGF